jgi:anti-sigma regulatory factor (Ser/Thr protein kinase)
MQRFPACGQALRAARRFVVETLEAWGRTDLVDDATLVTTELATNAVVHAQSDFEVAMTQQEGVVRIAVRDASPTPPNPSASAAMAISGRGLMIVGLLASRWGHDVFYDGKQVWVELAG